MKAKPFGLSVKAIVRDRHGRILLLQRSRECRFFGGQWDLPGGKVNRGEAFDAALRREVGEETGLRTKITGVAGTMEQELPETQVILLFLETRHEGGNVRLSEEHEQFKWVTLMEAGKMDLSPQVRSVIADFARRNSRRRAK